jgi:hypothetical protein
MGRMHLLRNTGVCCLRIARGSCEPNRERDASMFEIFKLIEVMLEFCCAPYRDLNDDGS